MNSNRKQQGKKWVIQMEKRKKKNPKKRIAIIMTVVCIMVMVSLAWWFYHTKRPIKTEERDVMVPYYLYFLNEDLSDYFQLQVANMHPGETKRCIVCVSNKDKDKTESDLTYSVGRESEFQYELGFAYTQNIPLDYTVYELKPHVSNGAETVNDGENGIFRMESGSVWEKVKDNSGELKPLEKKDNSSEETNKEMYDGSDINNIVNLGKYDIYRTDANGKDMQLKTTYSGNTPTFEYDYYLIEINWKEGVTNFTDYLKETDLVYVSVKAGQPKPAQKNTEENTGN